MMAQAPNEPAMVELIGVTRAFGVKQVLCGVDFSVATHGLVGLIGPSGGGKSILLKIIAGVAKSDSGAITRGVSEHELALMFQEGALFDSLSVFDNVAFPIVGGRVPTSSLPRDVRSMVRDQVEEILTQVGLVQAASRLPGEISGGMRRRVSLARALIQRPKLLLLDDPTSGLDPIASRVIMELIGKIHHESGLTTIMVSQDLRRLIPAVERVAALFDGRIIFEGTIDELARGDGDDTARVKSFVACRYDGLSAKGAPGDGIPGQVVGTNV